MNSQHIQVINAMRKNGGCATFRQLNSWVDTSNWKTQTPDATIRRIVQTHPEFFRIHRGFWALTECRESVLKELGLDVFESDDPGEQYQKSTDFHPEALSEPESRLLPDGMKTQIIVNTYERNPQARRKCLEHWGHLCVVCDFDFEEMYGVLGRDYIHVHHLTPLSEIGESYLVDPVNDLRPVCPNCHAMLHRGTVLTIEQLQEIIQKAHQ